MVSANMLNKTSLSKPLKEILQFCCKTVVLQILVKKSFKDFFKVRSFDKFVVEATC